MEKRLIVDDLLLTYYEYPGPRKASTVLFLHGWGSSSELWMKIFQQFSDRFNLLYLDLPGFGRSQQPKEVWGVRDYAECVERFLGKLEVRNPVIVGHSFGGSIGMLLAAKTRALVLIDSAGVRPRTPKKNLQKIIAAMARPLFRPAFMQPLRKQLYKAIGSDYPDNPPLLQKIYSRVVGEDLTPLFNRVTQPVLLVWGENDTETPVADARLMHAKMKHSTLKIIPDAGHFPFLDKPEKVLVNIREFLYG